MDHPTLPDTADDMFCHAVYVAWHAINRAYKPHLSSLGLTYPQYITLVLLWERDGQTIGELATSLGMDSSTLTPLVKRLEKLGHVARTRGTSDERQVFVHLTPVGKALQAQAPAITACMIDKTGLSAADLTSMVGLLRGMATGLKEAASAPASTKPG